MRVDPVTLLFEDMTPAEADEIQAVAEAIVLHGKMPYPLPAHIEQWLTANQFDEQQRMLVLWTAYPQRALLSVLRFVCEATK